MSSLAASLLLMGCGTTKRVVEHLPTPPERLVCEAAGTRPVIPAEYQIDWTRVTSVAQAKVEHERYVASIRDREGVIVAYLMRVEGKLFVCSNNVQWRREYEAGLTTPSG
jgi:hypothetical protein